MKSLVEARLEARRKELHHLRGCIDEQMSMPIRTRDMLALRFLHGEERLKRVVIEELELILDQASRPWP